MSGDNNSYLRDITLIDYKLRNGEKRLSLQTIRYKDATTLLEEDDNTSRADIFKKFFKILSKKWFEKLTIYGVQADEDTKALMRAAKGPFHFNVLVYDSSADEILVHTILNKCSNFQSVLKKSEDNSFKFADWKDLPRELKEKCFETMPFISKMRMRRVAKAEKSMTEGKKHKFKMVTVGEDADSYWVASLDDNNDTIVRRDHKNCVDRPVISAAAELFQNAFRYGEVKQFRVHGGCRDPDIYLHGLGERFKCDVFTVSCEGSFQNDAALQVFLEHLLSHTPPKVFDLVEVSQRFSSRALRDNQFLDVLLIAKELYVADSGPYVVKSNFLRYPITRPPSIGTAHIYIGTRYNNQDILQVKEATMNSLVQGFADQIVYQDNGGIRISTTDPQKHIVFRFYSASDAAWTHAIWKCIESTMSNEEVETTTRWQWISSKSTPDPSNRSIPLHLLDSSNVDEVIYL